MPTATTNQSMPGQTDHTSARPPAASTLHLLWADETDTQTFAQRLACQPALRNATLTLHGDLGAGKTTFVRHLLRALGVAGRIKSPTYAVVEPHHAPGLPGGTTNTTDTATTASTSDAACTAPLDIWHFDFYRFDDPREWEDAGFRDLFASPGLKLVEWPDKAGDTLPTPDLSLHLHTQDDDSRQVSLSAHTATGQQCLTGLSRLAGLTPTPPTQPHSESTAP